jgi:hypothetical protein
MNTQNNWLPQDYVKPAGNSNYFKFEEGNNKFRIMSAPIVGWIDWAEEVCYGKRKPIRTKQKPEKAFDPERPPRHFWAFIIWDYKSESLQIMEVTQTTIQDAIYGLQLDEQWGSPTGYDINVSRKGEKMETKYQVIPSPPQQVCQEAQTAYTESSIELQALFVGGDPFDEENKQNENQSIEEEPIPVEF